MNPTVSENSIGPNSGSMFFLVTESSVANNLSSASCLLFVRELNKVVLPALVYPTRAIYLLQVVYYLLGN